MIFINKRDQVYFAVIATLIITAVVSIIRAVMTYSLQTSIMGCVIFVVSVMAVFITIEVYIQKTPSKATNKTRGY